VDLGTGKVYPSKEAAIAEGVPEDRLVTGPEKAIRYASRRIRMASRLEGERRKRRRKLEKQARKRMRR